MYPCTSPLLPSISRKKTRFFQRFRKEDVQKHRVFPDFRQKDAGSPSQQKSRQGESSLGPLFCDTGSPKTTFSGTSSNCRAVRGGPPPPKSLRNRRRVGGVRGGVILYPLVSIRHAEQCRRIYVLTDAEQFHFCKFDDCHCASICIQACFGGLKHHLCHMSVVGSFYTLCVCDLFPPICV